MSVQLDLLVTNPVHSTYEALHLACTLRNTGNDALTIPSPYDRSGSLQIALFDESDTGLRIMDRQTRQFMMTQGRVDSALDLDTLAARATWSWPMDMASFHYPIPPGDYRVRGAYAYEPEQVLTETEAQSLRVTEAPLQSLDVVRDNPIIDGLTLFMHAEGAGESGHYLRLHNYARPLGAWWSTRVAMDKDAGTPFCATANFYQSASTDWFHRKWIVWQAGGDVVQARCLDRGDTMPVSHAPASSNARQAPLPAGATLLRAALCSRSGDVFVFVRNSAGHLECLALLDDRLDPRWELELPGDANAPIAIAGDAAGVHVVTAWRGLHYSRVNDEGHVVEQRQMFRTRLAPYSIQIEAAEQRVKGLFFEGGHGKVVHLVVCDLASNERRESRIEQLPLAADVTELAFDQDRAGRFHLLATTSAQRLYYYSEGRGPILVAAGEARFFPVVVAPQEVYFGLYRRNHGYRFVQYQRRRQGKKFVGLDDHP